MFRQLVGLLLESTDTESVQKNLTQARSLFESLQQAELVNFFRETCIDARKLTQLTSKRQLSTLLEQPAASVCVLLEQIKTALFAHIDNAQQFDDITMLAVQRLI